MVLSLVLHCTSRSNRKPTIWSSFPSRTQYTFCRQYWSFRYNRNDSFQQVDYAIYQESSFVLDVCYGVKKHEMGGFGAKPILVNRITRKLRCMNIDESVSQSTMYHGCNNVRGYEIAMLCLNFV
nr:hypothetical protein CFP56_52467 [Quercus suber]